MNALSNNLGIRERHGRGGTKAGWLGALALALAGQLAASAAAERFEIRKPHVAVQPVLLVIADGADFHYREYAETRRSLEAAGLRVQVAATTTRPSYPHRGSGEPSTSRQATPWPSSAITRRNTSACSASVTA